MTWLLSLLFPLWILLPRARALGGVAFTTVDGVGWQCTIRPPHDLNAPRTRRGVNAWSATGRSLGGSLRAALALAAEVPTLDHTGSRYAPRLGGAEFDDE